MRPSGNTILITGGGRGSGRGLAEKLHERGNLVIIAGSRLERLAEVAGANPGIETLALDVTDVESIGRAVADVLHRHPTLNVLINNAGVLEADGPAAAIDDAALLRTVSTNLLAPIRMISALIDHLRSQPESTIINVTSMPGDQPFAAAASAASAAMHSFTQSLRRRLGEGGPEVIEVSPPSSGDPWHPADPVERRAMPVDEFIALTIAGLDAFKQDVFVSAARTRRG